MTRGKNAMTKWSDVKKTMFTPARIAKMEREAADVIAKIRAGIAAPDRGEVDAHEDVMDELEAIVTAAERRPR
jgi:predicted transcriptional regulator